MQTSILIFEKIVNLFDSVAIVKVLILKYDYLNFKNKLKYFEDRKNRIVIWEYYTSVHKYTVINNLFFKKRAIIRGWF